jgi:hypothetical protein
MMNDKLLMMNKKVNQSFTILLGLMLAMLFSCQVKTTKDEPNQLTVEEKKAGWELLFDGKTLDGWRGLGRDSVMTDFWKVDNGSIHKIDNKLVPLRADRQKVNGGDLMTKDTFENFELTFEWMIKDAGNSGIKYNVSEEISKTNGSGFNALGFEYQILDDDDTLYVGKIKPCQFTGSLYDMIAPQNVKLNPAGQYNSGKIVLNGNHGEHWLNDEKVVEFEFGSAQFDSLFQASKYSKYPDFEKRRAGHIVITNHSDESWYRNIKIRKL